jgi:peptide alpha-N-acetyltransferase
LNSALDSLPAKVQEALKAEFTAIPASADLKKLNAEFLEKHSNSATHRIAAARAAKVLGEQRTSYEKILAEALRADSITFVDAAAVLEQLRNWRSTEVTSFQKAAHEKWPEVTLFA